MKEKIDEQKIGNKEPNSGFVLSCIICSRKENLSLNAHRNRKEEITGFVIVCNICIIPEFLHLSTFSKPDLRPLDEAYNQSPK